MIGTAELTALRDELIRKQSMQQQAQLAAKQALAEIKSHLDSIKDVTNNSIEIGNTYPEIMEITNLNVDDLLLDQNNIPVIKERINNLIEKIYKDVEGVLDV